MRTVIIRGAGDLATGVACRLYKSGFKILMTDIEKPTAIRRTVAFSESIVKGDMEIEGIKAEKISSLSHVEEVWKRGSIPVIVDESAQCIKEIKPSIVVDAILAKKNLGTKITDAPIVIALGPGFTAGYDCHAVVETKRGHYLGKVYYEGSAIPNTGVPGDIGGESARRILRAPCVGEFKGINKIGDIVKAGDKVAEVNGQPIIAEISGVLRGILPDGCNVFKGMKSGDIDPRAEVEHCFSVSDKARSLGGGVLEAILYFTNNI